MNPAGGYTDYVAVIVAQVKPEWLVYASVIVDGHLQHCICTVKNKDSAKTFVQETLKDTRESAGEWFVH